MSFYQNKNASDKDFDIFITYVTEHIMTCQHIHQIKNINLFLCQIISMGTPNTNQVDKILCSINLLHMRYATYCYEWIASLKKKYTFTNKQTVKLWKIGYIDINCEELMSNNDDIIKKYIINILSIFIDNEHQYLLYHENVNFSKIKELIIFDDDYYDTFDNLHNNSIRKQGMQFYDLINCYGYEYNAYGLNKHLEWSIINKDAFSSVLRKFVENDIIPSPSLITQYVKQYMLGGTYMLIILNIMLKKNMPIEHNIINVLKLCYDDDNHYDNNDGHDINNYYIKLFNYALKNGFVPSYETIIFSCQTNNIMLFKLCGEHKIIPDIGCLYMSCKNNNISIFKELMDMKIIPDSKCLEECLSFKFGSSSMLIDVLINEGIQLSECQLEKIIMKGRPFPDKCKITDAKIYDTYHKYGMTKTDSKLIPAKMLKSKRHKLKKMILNKSKKITYDETIKYAKKEKLDFDSQCYDEILIKHHAKILSSITHYDDNADDDKYNDSLCDAIKNKKYIVTLEAISRCDDHMYRMVMLEYYGFLKN
jgi:hypothetical protein